MKDDLIVMSSAKHEPIALLRRMYKEGPAGIHPCIRSVFGYMGYISVGCSVAELSKAATLTLVEVRRTRSVLAKLGYIAINRFVTLPQPELATVGANYNELFADLTADYAETFSSAASVRTAALHAITKRYGTAELPGVHKETLIWRAQTSIAALEGVAPQVDRKIEGLIKQRANALEERNS